MCSPCASTTDCPSLMPTRMAWSLWRFLVVCRTENLRPKSPTPWLCSAAKAEQANPLKELNEFRQEFKMPTVETMPSNVSVHIHPITRSRTLLLHAHRFVNGNRVDYTFDGSSCSC